MPGPFVYRFTWDAAKATSNRRKHQVSFEVASSVFGDPLALSRYDVEHFEGEDRWVTLGQAENAMLLVVVHTFEELNSNEARVRIISARNATARERAQYESGHAPQVNAMKDEYDFSNATRGKFHRHRCRAGNSGVP